VVPTKQFFSNTDFHHLSMFTMKSLLRIVAFSIVLLNGSFAQGLKADTVLLSTPTGSLEAILNYPAGASKPTPVVLLLAGSGPTDRDGNSPSGIKTNMYKLLADALGAKGIATLRPDKRGVARNLKTVQKEEDLLFDSYIEDAAGWVSWLRKDPRFSKIIVVGHSEGSLVGMIAAQRSTADGYVSLAGGGTNIADVLKEQLKTLPDSLRKPAYEGLDLLRRGEKVSNPPKMLMSLFRPSVQPFLISWMKYDPAQEIKRLTIPILIVQGTTDIQVGLSDSQKLATAVPRATYAEISGMNHVLKDAPLNRADNIATYSKPTLPLSGALIETLTKFLAQF
jgi:uncharacterized protein